MKYLTHMKYNTYCAIFIVKNRILDKIRFRAFLAKVFLGVLLLILDLYAVLIVHFKACILAYDNGQKVYGVFV